MQIRLSKSGISRNEVDAVTRVMRDEYFGMGSTAELFENNLKKFLGKNACVVSSGTAALQLALEALGVEPGDEVIIPTLTYVATFQATKATQATPIAADVDPQTLNLCLESVKRNMSDKVNTIIFVPIGGDLTGITDIERFCNKNNLHLVIDAAHAFGSSLNGKGASDFGDCVCYSFDGIKNITCGEGGCVSSNCDEIIEKIKIRRALGIEKVSPSAAGNSYDFQVNQNGWRYHLSNINAAIGNEQLKRLDVIWLSIIMHCLVQLKILRFFRKIMMKSVPTYIFVYCQITLTEMFCEIAC